MNLKRTSTCGELGKKDIKKAVCLSGWVQSSRDHGGIIFIDLRDRHGLTQAVFDPKHDKKTHKEAESLRREDVVSVRGKDRARGKGLENPNLKTGEIEILADELEILSRAETPPLEIEDRVEAGEEIRLKYRFLDLRRPKMQRHLLIRHRAAQAAREYLNKNNFLEIETPILVRATPEGARDYIVPSRVNPGKFYALPQSPQLYKQLLMIAGMDRYYQVPAPCLRDEDLRADRQPEHSQIDFEMSFVSQEEIMQFVEDLYKHVFKQVLKINLPKFSRLTYQEAKEEYGNDKPDLRFKLELTDITDIAEKSEFSVFKEVIKKKGIVKVINPEKEFSRKEIEDLTQFCIQAGAKGLAYMKLEKGKLESNIVKYFSPTLQRELIQKTKIKRGYLLFIADTSKKANAVLSELRLKLGKELGLIKENDFKFCWITDFPLFSYNDEENKWDPEHHMFTMPKEEHLQFLESNPGKILGQLYDVVLNGTELGSGSIRITRPDIQERVMKVIGMSKEEAYKKFGFLLDAYQFAGPIHGGMGLGFDRLVALMAGYKNIREVIAFPKNKEAQCPMAGSPAEVDAHQLKEANIKIDIQKKK